MGPAGSRGLGVPRWNKCCGVKGSDPPHVSRLHSVADSVKLTLVSFWPERYHCPFRRSREPLKHRGVFEPLRLEDSPEQRAQPAAQPGGPGARPETSLPGTKWAAHLCDLQSQQTACHIILTPLQNNAHLLFVDYIHSKFLLKTSKYFVLALFFPLYFNSFIQSIFWTTVDKCICSLVIQPQIKGKTLGPVHH